MTLSVMPDDLDLFLAMNGTIDTDRASLLIELATDLCTSVISPIPDTAKSVVLSAAARAYTNPEGVQGQTIGPESVQYGSATMGGLYLTKGDVATLKRMGGVGGAYSVQVMPADAGTNVPIWDENIWGFEGIDGFGAPDFFDDSALGI